MDSPPTGPIQTWWDGIAKARDCIQSLNRILGPLASLDALQESERPAKGLLEDESAADRICYHLSQPSSGSGDDEICRWLYETYQTGDGDLQAVVLRYVPILCGKYFARVTSKPDQSLAGFEAVLLALYTAETRVRGGSPLVVNIPDLSQPSLYHSPRIAANSSSAHPQVGQLAAALEPQVEVKATKRACIVSVALDLFCRRIAIMPTKAKIEACFYVQSWAGRCCSWVADGRTSTEPSLPLSGKLSSPETGESKVIPDENNANPSCSPLNLRTAREIEAVDAANQEHCVEIDGNPDYVSRPSLGSSTEDCQHSDAQAGKEEQGSSSSPNTENGEIRLPFGEAGNGDRIPLPWELLQPIIKLLGHCLLAPLNSQELRDAASTAIHALYRRASHDLVPQAILATRSLMRLDLAAKATAKAASAVMSTPSKPRKPEILLVSK